MGAALEFEWDSRDLDVWRGGKVEMALAKAIRKAGNEAIKEAQTASADHVTERKLLNREDALKGLPVDPQKGGDDIASMMWVERMAGKPMPLAKFPHFFTGQGVSVHVNAVSGFKNIKSAFNVRLSSGHVGIFRREGKERLPIHELWTSSVANVMSDAGALDVVSEHAISKMDKAFARAMSKEIKGLISKGDT